MVEAIIRFLITIVVLALIFFLCLWVLGEIGLVVPAMVLHLLYVLAVLIVILIAWRFFGGYLGGWGAWWGPRGP